MNGLFSSIVMSKEIKLFSILHACFISYTILTTFGVYAFHANNGFNGFLIWLSFFWITCPIGLVSLVFSIIHMILKLAKHIKESSDKAIAHFIFFALDTATYIICGVLWAIITGGV